MKLKHFFPLFLTLLFIASPALTAEKNPTVKDCHKKFMTQLDFNLCSRQDADKAQAELDKELALIKARIADSPEKIKKLEEAQKAWEADMHTQLDFLYFDHGGSAAPMCVNYEAEILIQERTKQLKQWADIKEDTCGGGLYRR